jgi:GNAT superfamily N-acetyltransferase
MVQEIDRVNVVVTFLRMDAPPADPAPPLPEGATVVQATACTVGFYRYLYAMVGERYVWWLRRTMPDRQLAALLRDPRIGIHVLYMNGEPAGFYELDATSFPIVNLSYFGLLPHAVGRGIGGAFLRHAVDSAWRGGTRAVTVNTCTADHPRALPTYIRTGFRVLRAVPELWEVPRSLGLVIPPALIV